MLSQVGQTVQEWKKKLKKGERISFLNIGELWVNKEGKIQFQPSEQVNFLTASYGLSSFVAVPATRELLKEQVVELESEVPLVFTPEQRQPFSAVFEICPPSFYWPYPLDLTATGPIDEGSTINI